MRSCPCTASQGFENRVWTVTYHRRGQSPSASGPNNWAIVNLPLTRTPAPTVYPHFSSHFYPPCHRASPITAMYVAGRGNPRAWGTAKAGREPGRSRVIQADARNPASCTEYGQAPPLSLLLAQAMTAQHGSKYGLGERVGVWLSESPPAASRSLKGDAEEGDGASNAPICPATVRHGQWSRRGNLRCVEMLRNRRQRQACPSRLTCGATQNSMRDPTPVRGQMACVRRMWAGPDISGSGHEQLGDEMNPGCGGRKRIVPPSSARLSQACTSQYSHGSFGKKCREGGSRSIEDARRPSCEHA